ncbi:MAG TPA: bifunctional diaminohydroxyphosphoribosylaminopyrimidine deaminase/5-amino-6-(5-phosphoribosylamino)uracil reductase RibD [Candidatus Acidoferrum sp.]|jgi:diaminohydroxyphosphoribosylaminopyrimidine deaminase/5-amino-6-(5-phosphoribosylamino)uracil reductase|nr:bifunctional diaminohydroxyphosphoribosylaminopyrimidine deaminase/5-amino-6-(5-phosphoribosylamino)uracil reductase RibD [Candidatus Acidoferrum sp.]
MASDLDLMRLALRLARRGYGATSPNPMVGAVLVKSAQIIGRGWHHRAGEPHAEIEALYNARQRGFNPKGSTLYVTLEPCSTQGRTPPCTEAIIRAGIKRVVVGATDPNPSHRGKAFQILKHAGITVTPGVLAEECVRLNTAFNYWIVHQTPFVTVKAAMTLDGKIATASGESKWITGPRARAYAMKLRQGADAILVGINTVLADNPSLTFRTSGGKVQRPSVGGHNRKRLRRIVLDSMARTPLNSKVAADEDAALTTIVVTEAAPKHRVAALSKRVKVLVAPATRVGRAVLSAPRTGMNRRRRPEDNSPHIDLRWLLKHLGRDNVTSLLVEGGGEVNASFLMQGLAHRVAFFYAPRILGGRDSLKAVAGRGARTLAETIDLADLEWRKLGPDRLLTARVAALK